MKRSTKKNIALLTALSITTLSLTACGGGGEDNTAKDGEITLTYQYWDLIPNQDEIFSKFTEEYLAETGITVNIDGQFVSGGDWESTVKTQIAAGSGPDVFHLDLGKFSGFRPVLQPIDKYFEDDFWDQFVPSAIDVWNYNDEQYAISNSFSVVSFLYNKTMFEEAGLDYNSDSEITLDEFEHIMETLYNTYNGKTVTDDDGNEYPYYVVGGTSAMYWWWMFFGFGGEALADTNNVAQEAYVDAAMKIAEYADKGWVVNANEIVPDKTSTAFSTAGNVAMYSTGDWTPTFFYRTHNGIGTDAMPITVDYASLKAPVGIDGKTHSEMYNQGIVMNKNLEGDRAEAAAALIEYMGSTDAWLAARGPEVGGLGIPAKKDWNAEYSTSWFDKPEQRSAFVDVANNGTIHTSDYNVGAVDLWGPVQESINVAYAAAIEDGPLDEAAVRAQVIEVLENGQKSINEQLAENGLESDNPDATIK